MNNESNNGIKQNRPKAIESKNQIEAIEQKVQIKKAIKGSGLTSKLSGLINRVCSRIGLYKVVLSSAAAYFEPLAREILKMKIIKLSYLAIIFLFSLSSTFTTWANDRNPILMLEITINLLIMAGLVFSIKKITIKWWSTIIALIFFGESTLLLTDQTIGAKEIFTWCLIL